MAKTFFANGQRYDIEDADIPRFKENAAAGGFEVEEGQRYRTDDGHIYNLPASKAEGFRESMPGAARVIPFKRDEDEKESYMTMGEVSQYLRSPEYRARHKSDAEQHSSAWAGVKGALSGAAEGLWEGANVAANKVAMAIPEVAGAVTQGVGNVLNGFGAANNAVGDWFVESGRNFASRVKDYASKIGLNLNEDVGEAVGFDDALTKIADKATDVSKMSVKFAPAMASGGGAALANTIFASDAINAATDIHDAAKDNGFSEAEAMSAAGAAGLINYFGAKLLPKAGAIGNSFKNPAMKFVAGAAGVGNAMGVQGAANQAVQNLATRQPFTEGVGDAYAEGQTEGLFFHTINGLPGAVIEIPGYRRARAASKAEKAFVRDAMLDAAESKDGAALLNTLMDGEGLQAAEMAVREGKPISRSVGRKAGLPDNMSAEERTKVISAVIDAKRNAEAERAKAEEIRGRDPLAAESEMRRADREAETARHDERQGDIETAFKDADVARVERDREITARRQQEIAEQKRQAEEYDRAERERIERERAEQEAAPTMNEERNRDYHDWLKRQGRKDTDKNFRKWLGQNEIENVTPEDAEMIRGKGVIEAERAEGEAKEAAKRKAETVDALQRMVGERESAEADAIARDKWEREQSRRADLDRRAEERGRAEDESLEANEAAREQFERHEARQGDLEAAFRDAEAKRVAKEREATLRRKAELEAEKRKREEYDLEEWYRKSREQAEAEAAPTMNEERSRDYHDWLKKQGRKDTDKNFRKWLGLNEIENVSAEDAEMIRGKGVIEAERAEGEAKEAAKRKAETVDALQRMVDERESAEADAIARDKWEREQSRKADLDRRAEERGIAEDESLEANELARDAFEKHEARQGDLEAAFKDYDAALAAAKAKQKQGKRVETPKAPEEIAEAVKDDAQLQELDRQYRSAQTADKRKEIEQKFAARVTELRQGMERKAAWQKENDQRAADRADAEAASWEADAKARAEWDAKHKDAPKNDAPSAEPSAPAPVASTPAAPTRGKAKRTPAKPAQETKPTAAKVEKPSASRGAPDAEQIANFKAQISEAKKANKDGSGSGKVFSAKVGPTSMTFAVSDDGIAAAERMLKRIENPKKWGKPSETRSVPKPPSATKVAKEPPSDTNEVLKPFVEKKSTRGLGEPISDGESTFATDGRVAVRVKSNSGEKRGDQDIAELTKRLFDEKAAKGTEAKTTTAELETACNQAMTVKSMNVGENTVIRRDEHGKTYEETTAQIENEAVELWRTKDGKVVVRARSNIDYGREVKLEPGISDEPSGAAFFNGKTLDGAKLLCRPNVGQLKNLCAAFAKMGDGEISISVSERGLLILKGKNIEAVATTIHSNEEYFADQMAKAEAVAKAHDPLWSKSPDAEMSERVDLRRLDPKRRSDPKVLDWAKKKGRTISDGKVTPDAVREYDAQMAKGAAKAARRWFPDMNITYHDYGENIKRGQHDIVLRDTSGRALGWFEPGTKNVHLLPGANAETVAHEIMWHGTRDWATKRAAAGDARAQKLLDMMHDVEKNAPEDLKNTVRRLYRKDYAGDADLLHNEFGAWLTMGKGGRALEAAMAKVENRTWYAKAFNAVKELFKDFLTKHGKNRIDLSKIDGMGRDEFVDFLASEFAGGKTLGKIGTKSGPTGELSTKETVVQKLRRKVYDINAAVRDLQRDIEKQTGKKLSDAEDVEAANALTPGLREAAVMNVRGKLAGYRDLLHKTGISDADAQYYMALKAAAGRDAKVDAKNLAKLDAKAEKDVRAEWGSEKIAADKDGFKAAVEQRKAEYRESYESTNGSHISPVEAKRMLAELESGEHAEGYAEIRDYLRDVMDETLDAQVKAGLISKEVAAKYRAEEPDYIPFKNEFDEATGEFGGRGNMMNLGRPEHYEAKGRSSSAGDITAHIFGDFQSSLLRGIETNVRQKLANLVKAHPEIGTVEKLSETNRLREKVKSDRKDKGNITGDPNLVLFKQDGDTYAIHLNGERGSAIAAAMTERNATKWDGWYPKFARWSAAAATRWSPTFSVRNFTKDNIELSNIVFSEKGAVGGAKWIGNYLKSQKDMAGTLAKYITTGKIDATTEQGKMLKSYIDNGGLISGGATEGYDAIKRSFTPEAIAKEMKKGDSRAKAIAKHTIKAITYLNEFAEMTTRVNAYVAELKSGATEQQAALFSRRATVDFNRKGENTGVTNIVRLFSNSTLGATARATTALARSKAGKGMAAALFANGFAQGLIEYCMNADADKKREKTGEATGKDVSEFDRKTSLFYLRNGDNLYRVAQHEGPFSLINYAGNCAARVMTGQMSLKDMAKNLGVSVAELAYHFTGMGDINMTSREGGIGEDAKAAIISGFCPSALQPLAEMLVGMDYKGDPLYKRNYSVTTPNSEVSKTHTPEYAKTAAAWMNEATGGNEARKGYVDVHPEAVQKLVEGFGKNAARDVMQAWEVGKAILTGDLKSLTPRDIPVKRDFVRPLDGNTARFYEAYNDFKADKDEFKKRKDWTPEEKREFRKAHPWVDATRGLQVDKVVDRKNTQTPRSGFRDMGINQLRKFCDGWVLRKDGSYVKPKKPVSDAEKEAAKKELLRKQALVVKRMGK